MRSKRWVEACAAEQNQFRLSATRAEQSPLSLELLEHAWTNGLRSPFCLSQREHAWAGARDGVDLELGLGDRIGNDARSDCVRHAPESLLRRMRRDPFSPEMLEVRAVDL